MNDLEYKTTMIMPGSSWGEKTTELCMRAVTTHAESCKADLIFLDNSSENQELMAQMEAHVTGLGYKYEFIDKPFCWAEICNYGVKKTPKRTEYVAFSNADVVFHTGWLTALLDLWNAEDNAEKFYSVHPYMRSSLSGGHTGVNYRSDSNPDNRLVPCDSPVMQTSLFRKPEVFEWDERFALYEADCDYWMWMKDNGYTAAIAYNSRVDHNSGQIVTNIGAQKYPVELGGRDAFVAKWSEKFGDII
jgi:GT2 family glycosyltransferase